MSTSYFRVRRHCDKFACECWKTEVRGIKMETSKKSIGENVVENKQIQ